MNGYNKTIIKDTIYFNYQSSPKFRFNLNKSWISFLFFNYGFSCRYKNIGTFVQQTLCGFVRKLTTPKVTL